MLVSETLGGDWVTRKSPGEGGVRDSGELLASSFTMKGHSRKVRCDAHWIPSLPRSYTSSFQNSKKEIPITHAIQFMLFYDSSCKIQKINLCKHCFFLGADFFSVLTAVNSSCTQIFAHDLMDLLWTPFPSQSIKLRHLHRGEEVTLRELGRVLASSQGVVLCHPCKLQMSTVNSLELIAAASL